MKNKSLKSFIAYFKKNKSSAVLLLIFFIGLCILAYPTVSNMINERHQSTAMVNYDTQMVQMQAAQKAKDLEEAKEYNQALLEVTDPLNNKELVPGYNDILSYDVNGLMGYVTIPAIDVKLPIYHGTSKNVLGMGVGHIQGSSFPIGGESTHAVLSGHTGLPGSKLFTDLSKVQEGDKFQIKILDNLVTYEVDQIKVVLPNESQDLVIEEGEDLCTLTTCTPYGINSHRLLVRGHRVPNEMPMEVGLSTFVIALRVALGIAVLLFALSLYITWRNHLKDMKEEEHEGESEGGDDIESKID